MGLLPFRISRGKILDTLLVFPEAIRKPGSRSEGEFESAQEVND